MCPPVIIRLSPSLGWASLPRWHIYSVQEAARKARGETLRIRCRGTLSKAIPPLPKHAALYSKQPPPSPHCKQPIGLSKRCALSQAIPPCLIPPNPLHPSPHFIPSNSSPHLSETSLSMLFMLFEASRCTRSQASLPCNVPFCPNHPPAPLCKHIPIPYLRHPPHTYPKDRPEPYKCPRFSYIQRCVVCLIILALPNHLENTSPKGQGATSNVSLA